MIRQSQSPSQPPEPSIPSPLKVSPSFCPSDVATPYDAFAWSRRDAVIQSSDGEPIFEQSGVEFPEHWSQTAVNIVASKYFFGEQRTAARENSLRQLVDRVVRTITDWGVADGYLSPEGGEIFYRDLAWLCLDQAAAFNSPVWFNVGLHDAYGVTSDRSVWRWNPSAGKATCDADAYVYPQASACFIQGVQDDMQSIMSLAASEALLFKYGSGSGTDLSTLRSRREVLSGGGKPSGPLSFMRVYDQVAGVVKSGGKTRRAAKMQSLKVEHPDILDFIQCKAKEEAKAQILIEHGGYDADFNGEAYNSVLFQNANLSVRVSDPFMEAVEQNLPWKTHWITKPEIEGPTYSARELLKQMAESAWQCGDPGVQYDTTINRWHTCPQSGRINASNPCSEYMFLDDSACNLASLNLIRFRAADGTFDAPRFAAACRLLLLAQEILVDRAGYPTATIAENSHRFRPLGLGYTNLGSLLMASGLPYDSDEARGTCAAITAILHGAALRTSSEIAAAHGPFAGFADNRDAMLAVVDDHAAALDKVQHAPPALLQYAKALWSEVKTAGERDGYRNAQATVLAPTGTISFFMDCDTTGIEPELALVKTKRLAGGGTLLLVNRTVKQGLKALGYEPNQVDAITEHLRTTGSMESAPHLRESDLPAFDCAFPAKPGGRSIPWRAHMEMMAAAQPFLSGAISKTVNLPEAATPQDIADAYLWGWRLGLKSLSIYRDNSKRSQPLSSGPADAFAPHRQEPSREHLPDTRRSITHKFNVAGHEGYLTVGLYPDGRPGELFITMAKEGSTIGGLIDCFGIACSIALQYGVPLDVLSRKFSHVRFEPMGVTSSRETPIAASVVDYIFQWLAKRFTNGYGNDFVKTKLEDASGVEVDASQTKHDLQQWSDAGMNVGQHGQGKADRSEIAPARELPAFHPRARNADADPVDGTNTAPQIDQDSAKTMGGEPWLVSRTEVASRTTFGRPSAESPSDAPICDRCGSLTVPSGTCYVCRNCGNSLGCS
ncbi:vitamin B12-dependent ribonucleotide reductase [Blastopirellula sp. JC732]|uniref:Vitamin B12-dependent ribonucleotide reductase n=1 Tax=Blastopirellula sediminis TaxID=2894196 RepID=A0A9X1ML20_9BACT|nr:vitamin B12-dependent ribonucleotide reductase [Blastopirellula sediminis]MCC9607569.1 vitamin B12-dependent ribonucleotide reductase [Blastopirellula sediminis]MCC9629138.1 vitamin B12-dependent ribonucleotide reductase [Blastopirellula sediminis]